MTDAIGRHPPPVSALLDLSGRTALVTGAGSGIGSGIAVRLAEAGAAVVVHFHASEEGAQQVVNRIRAAGGRATAVAADLTDPSAVSRLLDEASRIGIPELVVNNAGIYPLATILDMAPEEWTRVIAANLTTAHLVTQAVASRLRDAGLGGAIVNVASIEARNVAPAHSHYAASKAGLVMYTRASARELGPFGIRVNTVSPGLIWRPGLDEAWPEGVTRYRAAVPLGRLGAFDDVADTCLFLLSPAARWITGAEVVVDGGVLTNRAF